MRSPRRALVTLAIVGVLAAPLGCRGRGRAGTAVDWQHKTPYRTATALHHVPAQCAGGHLYIDLPASEKNEASRAAVDLLAARFLGGVAATTKDRRVFAELGEALRAEGLDPGRDTREIAICYRGDAGGFLAVFAGDYSGKDIFRAIERAAERLGDQPPTTEERRGIEYVRLGELAIVRVAPNVVALGEDLPALLALASDADRAAAWGYQPGHVAVARVGGVDELRLQVKDLGEEVSLELTVRTHKDQAAIEAQRTGVADRLGETPLRALAPLARDAKIAVANGNATLLLRGKSADVASALQIASELPPAELKKIIGYVFGGTDGTGAPEQKI